MNLGMTAAGLPIGPAFATTTTRGFGASPSAAAAASTPDKILATTTTKAYAVTIVVPKIHRCYIPPADEQDDEEESVTATSSMIDTLMDKASAVSMKVTGKGGTSGAMGNNRSRANTGTASHKRQTPPDQLSTKHFMVYDDFSNGKEHPLRKQAKQDALQASTSSPPANDSAAPHSAFHPMEGRHETEGMVLELKPKLMAPMSNSVDTTEQSTRSGNPSSRLSSEDRHEVMMNMNFVGNDGTSGGRNNQPTIGDTSTLGTNDSDGRVTPPPSYILPPSMMTRYQSNDSNLDLTSMATQGQSLSPSGEIIGYVQEAATPKATGNLKGRGGHKKTSSNIPMIKDIVTAEEMAAVVKLEAQPDPSIDNLSQPNGLANKSVHRKTPSYVPSVVDIAQDVSSTGEESVKTRCSKGRGHKKTSSNIPLITDSNVDLAAMVEQFHDPSAEIIGYVQEELTPKITMKGRGHKKTSSNIPVIKDIVTAEEMAAVVKLMTPTDPSMDDTSKDNATANNGYYNNTSSYNPTDMDTTQDRDTAIQCNSNFSQESRRSPTEGRDHFDKSRMMIAENDDFPGTDPDAQGKINPPTPNTTGPKHNTEIKVSVLVELALKDLREQGHLLNRPVSIDVTSNDNEFVEFTILAKDPSIGMILERLERIGVGSSVGSVSIFKAELCRTADLFTSVTENDGGNGQTNKSDRSDINCPNGGGGANQSTDADSAADNLTARNAKIAAARMEWRNAASRLRVEQVKEQIHEQAELSFDYVSLLVIASILAGLGLITNSVVVIVASMLVSPLMGPVMGMTFGSRVLDWELTKFSLRNELVSLSICIIVGMLIALSSFWTESAEDWPTNEMASRGTQVGLLTGIAIAIPSGMGVALAILGDNTSSLVGVAISASLLPPAVNAGLCWVYAFLLRVDAAENNNEGEYDFGLTGTISLALTIVNILCIWVAGIALFAIKEVAPSSLKLKSVFWENDIKVARAIKKGNRKIDINVIKAGLQDALEKQELAKQQGAQQEHPIRLSQRRSCTPQGRSPTPQRRTSTPQRRSSTQRKHPHFHHHNHQPSPSGMANVNIPANSSVEESVFEEIIDDILVPSPLFDDIKSMSVTEMQTLLGFDGDADGFIEEMEPPVMPILNEESEAAAPWYKLWYTTL